MKKVSSEVAGICGLFCGTCPAFPETCEGCLSDKVAEHCVDCVAGFRNCSREHEVLRCYECTEFPCNRLEKFSHEHILNGVCHHTFVIDNLRRMKEAGIATWLEEQTAQTTCPECGEFIIWYETTCHNCGQKKQP